MIGSLIAGGLAAIPPLLQYLTSGNKSAQPEQLQQIQRFNPQTTQLQNTLAQFAGNKLTGNQFDFGPIESQARKGFQTQTIPSIMQRFASNENLGSSGLTSALGGAGKDLEMALAAMKEQYGLNQQGNLLSMLGLGMQPQFETAFRPEKQSDLQTLLAALSQMGGQIGGSYFGGKFSNPEYWQQPQQQGVPANQVVGPYSAYSAQNKL